MADSADTDKVLIALKKGSQLLKYGRQGKPKFYPFRLSNDESTLIWVSGGKEKSLKLSSVSRILSGQRTLVFKRFLLPEKDHLSFSLIYNDGKRSLDLICKDKVEAETWFTGLSALILSGHRKSPNINGSHIGGYSLEVGRESSLSSNSTTTADSSEIKSSTSTSNKDRSSEELLFQGRTDVTNMQVKNAAYTDIRVSISSALSTSTHSSGGDDSESFGDVYVWGEAICDGAGADRNFGNTKGDIFVPKPLESNVMLDVVYVACGVKHAALVTRQAEVFTWGEECSGRLGHGVKTSAAQPRLVESLSACNVEMVACGEFHSCAISATGELYTWGDGTHNTGILGHGTELGHWIPKRLSGPTENFQVSTVSCGIWHTAVITTAGQLYTFGDGTFGALGHGDRETALCPREVLSLKGLKTLYVSCGVWHTAAVVEVIVSQSSGASGKLFTWGDADKYRLGHGDKAPKLQPTCVSALIDYNFHKTACGHSLTVGLTTSGHVFTMGSSVYGQLGNPNSDGKIPCLVEERIGGGSVGEVVCGAYHVAALTQAGEVYTWGKGANGRLGHGDIDDRKTPTLVEALRDRSVKQIACGSSFTVAICQHKWVSGAEQSQCSACKQPFGFTRKRHNCYNCGLVHCHACSSKKALGAALSPNPEKPYRVCDTCNAKLSRLANSRTHNMSNSYFSGETRTEKTGTYTLDIIRSLDSKAAKQAKASHSLLQLKDISLGGGASQQQIPPPLVSPPSGSSANGRRATSPFSKVGSYNSFTSSWDGSESLKEELALLKQENQKLKAEVASLQQQCERKDIELQRSETNAQEAMALLAEELAKSKAAKECIKSLTAQLKEMAERLPPGDYEFKRSIVATDAGSTNSGRYDPTKSLYPQSPTSLHTAQNFPARNLPEANVSPTISFNSRAYNPRSEELHGNRETDRFQQQAVISRNANSARQIGDEWIEQYEPGVYLTLVALDDGTRELKRVRFSRRRFGENQAEGWWSENREKVYDKYNIRGADALSNSVMPP